MLCQICNENQATIHIKKIFNGKEDDLHICSDCALKQDLMKNPQNMTAQLKIPNVLESFEKLFGQTSEVDRLKEFFKEHVTCPHCEWSTEDFRKNMRLGCPECWHVFNPILDRLISQWHVGTRHIATEKITHSNEQKTLQYVEAITSLERVLNRLIEEENYEKAAEVRDKIESIKSHFYQAFEGEKNA